MSMHMIQGVQVHGKSKKKKAPGWKQRAADHEAFMKKMGVGKVKADAGNSIPDYNTGPRMTSDKVAGNGTKMEGKKYTGTLIKGIATMHKSNAVPVMKGTSQAVDIARMRRG